MNRDKLREIREWGTFILSFATVIAIPVGYLLLSNQRMEIEREVANKYVSKETYEQDRARSDQDRLSVAGRLGELQGKLDNVLMEQVRLNDSMAAIKEQLHFKNGGN